ncbi:MAG: hypothetical protein H0X58_01900 [Acidimicrobiia bacterium]|nr:hypothetical protein [Acidimicrobiia bacterium]
MAIQIEDRGISTTSQGGSAAAKRASVVTSEQSRCRPVHVEAIEHPDPVAQLQRSLKVSSVGENQFLA